LRGDVIHPRHAVEPEVERCRGGIGRAVHVQQNPVGRNREFLRALVADVELDARCVRRNGDVLGHQRGHPGLDLILMRGCVVGHRGEDCDDGCGQKHSGNGLQIGLLERALSALDVTVAESDCVRHPA